MRMARTRHMTGDLTRNVNNGVSRGYRRPSLSGRPPAVECHPLPVPYAWGPDNPWIVIKHVLKERCGGKPTPILPQQLVSKVQGGVVSQYDREHPRRQKLLANDAHNARSMQSISH